MCARDPLALVWSNRSIRRVGAVHGDGILHEWPHLRGCQTLRLQLGGDLRHRDPERAWLPAEAKVVHVAPRKTVVVAPFVRNGDHPIRWADVQPVIRQQRQKLGIRRVGMADSRRDQDSCRGRKNRTEWIDSHAQVWHPSVTTASSGAMLTRDVVRQHFRSYRPERMSRARATPRMRSGPRANSGGELVCRRGDPAPTADNSVPTVDIRTTYVHVI